jgi:sodium/hydrogen exchanger 8
VLGLCILAAYLIKKYRFYYMPESAAALLVGLLVGGVARLITGNAEELHFLSFQPELFFFLLLPPIIFEAGYTLRRKHFFRNLGTIVSYAVIGTLISTFIVGYLTFEIGRAGWIRIDRQNPMEALLFGALISAVDPVATLRRAPNLLSLSLSLRPRPRPLLPSPRVADRATAPPSAPAPRRSIMGSAELNCDPLLYSLVFGESVLNDAVAIVLFKSWERVYASEEQFHAATLLLALVNFAVVSVGSVFIGVITGLNCSYLCRHSALGQHPKYEILLLFLFAYGSYAFAELVELSGIMALFFCGVVLAHYNSYNLSPTTRVAAHSFFASLSSMAELCIYLYMGLSLFRLQSWNPRFIAAAIAAVLVARALNIFPFAAIANIGRTHKISIQMQVVIWFGGLRGAIAFSLAQNMPQRNHDLYAATTLAIVMFTTVVCGGLTEPLLTVTGMKLRKESAPPPGRARGGGGSGGGAAKNAAELETLDGSAGESSSDESEDGETSTTELSQLISPDSQQQMPRTVRSRRRHSNTLHEIWKDIDSNYMKPLFGGSRDDGKSSWQPEQ